MRLDISCKVSLRQDGHAGYHQAWLDARSAIYFCLLGWSDLALLLREDDVRALLPMSKAVALMHDVFRLSGERRAENQPRRRIRFPGGVFHYMAASLPDARAVGLKAYAATRGGIQFVALLFDTETGSVLAIIEADWLGRIRTGAASGLATRLLARPEARTAGVIGAGGQAVTQIEALAAASHIERIKVYSRSRERREELVRQLEDTLPCRLEAVSTAREAVENLDVVTTITTASEPVFDGSWLMQGCHVNAAGSNMAQRREIDTATVRRASCIAVDSLEQARIESGDLIAAVDAGALAWDRVRELGDIAAGTVQGRTRAEEITLYESQGVAAEDVIAARYVYDEALKQGRGQQVDFGGAG
jgi:alanine dehydrogenase